MDESYNTDFICMARAMIQTSSLSLLHVSSYHYMYIYIHFFRYIHIHSDSDRAWSARVCVYNTSDRALGNGLVRWETHAVPTKSSSDECGVERDEKPACALNREPLKQHGTIPQSSEVQYKFRRRTPCEPHAS